MIKSDLLWTGDCIWSSWVCDGEADCIQHEDEANCHGPSVKPHDSPCPEFLCVRSGGCVPNSALCNGRRDCADNSDEEGCGSVIHGNPSLFDHSLVLFLTLLCFFLTGNSSAVSCPPGRFHCDEIQCLPLNLICNNHTDCYDGSDELDCHLNRTIVYQVPFASI